jgi:uncharacterized membrane protein
VEYLSLTFLHVLFAILWAGGAISAGFFFIPSVLDAGPAGGAVMAGVVKRRLPLVLTTSAFVVVLTGLRLYMLRFTAAWLTSPEGLALTLGGLLGLGAFAIGIFVQKPTAERLATLGGQVAASGGPPTPEQAAELARLRARLGRVAVVLAWHLIVAAILMSSHRLLAAF